LEHIEESHEAYVIKDKKKRRVAEDYNCIRPCLVRTEIANHLVPTPLHLNMGIAQRLLDSIKEKCESWGSGDILEQILNEHNVRLSHQHGGSLTGDAAIRFFSIIKPKEGQSITIDELPLPNSEGEWFIQWSTLMHL
jgi:hypothetical protein